MTATTLDLRYRTHDLLASLARGVRVVITYRGQKAGILSPYTEDAEPGAEDGNPFALHGRSGCSCCRPACLRPSLFRVGEADNAERGGRDGCIAWGTV